MEFEGRLGEPRLWKKTVSMKPEQKVIAVARASHVLTFI